MYTVPLTLKLACVPAYKSCVHTQYAFLSPSLYINLLLYDCRFAFIYWTSSYCVEFKFNINYIFISLYANSILFGLQLLMNVPHRHVANTPVSTRALTSGVFVLIIWLAGSVKLRPTTAVIMTVKRVPRATVTRQTTPAIVPVDFLECFVKMNQVNKNLSWIK